MEQKPMSIHNFKRGDVITRLIPSAPHPAGEAMGYSGDEVRDRAYIGAALVFLGIANGCINLERWERPVEEDPENELGIPSFGSFISKLMGGGGPITLPLDMWTEGWAHYVDPYNLPKFTEAGEEIRSLDEVHGSFIDNLKEDLQKKLENALKEEDYKLADRIQKKLDKLDEE